MIPGKHCKMSQTRASSKKILPQDDVIILYEAILLGRRLRQYNLSITWRLTPDWPHQKIRWCCEFPFYANVFVVHAASGAKSFHIQLGPMIRVYPKKI